MYDLVTAIDPVDQRLAIALTLHGKFAARFYDLVDVLDRAFSVEGVARALVTACDPEATLQVLAKVERGVRSAVEEYRAS